MADRVLTRDFGLLVSGHFLQGLGWASMLLLPLYLHALDASRGQIGAIMAASAVGGLAVRPAVGWSLDRLGRRPTLFAGTVVMAVALWLVGRVHEVGPLVYGARALFGVALALLFTGYFTFVSDLLPESRRTEGIALFGISGLVPLLANPVAPRVGLTGPDLPIVFTVLGFVVLGSIPLVALIPEPRHPAGATPVTPAAAWQALRARPLWPVWAATVLFSGLVAVFAAFVTVMAAGTGMTDPTTIWVAYAVGAVAVRAFGARLPERFGLPVVAGGALLSYVAAAMVAGLAATDAGFWAAGVLAGVGHGYCFPVLASQTASRAPRSLRGTAMATYTGLWDASALVLVPLAGRLSDRVGDHVMFEVAGLLTLVGVCGWAALEHAQGSAGPAGAADRDAV